MAIFVFTLILTLLFMNGEKLGIRVVADEDAETYTGGKYFTANDLDGTWSDNDYTTYITLDGTGGKIKGNGAYFLNGDLVISNAGWYVISGTLDDGGIVVDAYDSSKIWIRLNGVTINCADDACLRIDQADKVFLTLAEGTENSFTSGKEYSEDALADNTGGTIFSHDDLTINGSGSLAVTAGYKHGIDVNDSLVITGGDITVTAVQDGIHVNDAFNFANASLTVNATDDGIHSDGGIYVESGTIRIPSCYEGMEAVTIDIAGGDIEIYPGDDGINANGGSSNMGFGRMGFGNGQKPDFNGERPEFGQMPSDGEQSGSGTGQKQFGGKHMPQDGEQSESDTGQKQFGGKHMPQDGEQSESDAGQKQQDGDRMPPEAEQMQQTTEQSESDTEDEETYIRISGGRVTIINETGRDADGLDSNGSIYIDGGEICISLPGDGGNNAIDYGSESGGECIVTGGTILGFGGSSMVEEFSSDSTQCAVLNNLDTTMEAGTLYQVLDANGNELISFTPQCGYSSVAFSIPDLIIGETYTIISGDYTEEFTAESTAVLVGESGAMGGGMGARPGGMRPEGEETSGEAKTF